MKSFTSSPDVALQVMWHSSSGLVCKQNKCHSQQLVVLIGQYRSCDVVFGSGKAIQCTSASNTLSAISWLPLSRNGLFGGGSRNESVTPGSITMFATTSPTLLFSSKFTTWPLQTGEKQRYQSYQSDSSLCPDPKALVCFTSSYEAAICPSIHRPASFSNFVVSLHGLKEIQWNRLYS